MAKRIDGVYLIKNNITLRVRVGSAKDINKRFSNYKARLRGGIANKLMQEDYNNYGEQSFEFIVLEECNVADLFKREQYYLDLYADCAKYNKNRIIDTAKKIRRGKEAKNYKAKRSGITSGILNGNAKLNEDDVINILEMLEKKISRKEIAIKYNINANYIGRIGKDRWVKVYEEWIKQKEAINIAV